MVEFLHRDNREKQQRIEELLQRLQDQEHDWRNRLEEMEKKGEPGGVWEGGGLGSCGTRGQWDRAPFVRVGRLKLRFGFWAD